MPHASDARWSVAAWSNATSRILRLAADTHAGPLDDLLGHSITYRIAVGPRAGQKLFTLQTVAPRPQGLQGEPNGAARATIEVVRGVRIQSTDRKPGTIRGARGQEQGFHGRRVAVGEGERARGLCELTQQFQWQTATARSSQ